MSSSVCRLDVSSRPSSPNAYTSAVAPGRAVEKIVSRSRSVSTPMASATSGAPEPVRIGTMNHATGRALPAWTAHRQLGFRIRTNELRRTVEREVQALPERRCAQPLAAAQGILRRQNEARPVDDAEGDHVLGHERRRHPRAELLGFLGAAPDPLGRVAALRHEAGGARHHVGVGGDARSLGHVLADPHVESLHDRAEQGFEACAARLGERRPHARVRPDPESDQQCPEQDRRRVAPGLRLDEPGDQVGDRAGARVRIARADVDRALLRLRSRGWPRIAHRCTCAAQVARAVSLTAGSAVRPIVACTGAGGQPWRRGLGRTVSPRRSGRSRARPSPVR